MPDYIGIKLNGVGLEGLENYKQLAKSTSLDQSEFHSKDISNYLWMET